LFAQVGFSRDGKLQAVDVTMYSNNGYTSEFGWVVNMIPCTAMKNGCNNIQIYVDVIRKRVPYFSLISHLLLVMDGYPAQPSGSGWFSTNR